MASLFPFRDVNLHASPAHYAFSSPSNPAAPTLVIDRPSGDIRLHDGKVTGSQRVSSISGVLGILRLKLDSYVVVVTKSQPMGRLKGHEIFKVIATEFLPLRERQIHDPDEDQYYATTKEILRSGPLYFSYTLDITNSFQRQAEADLSQPLWARADDRFFWNRFIQEDLIDFRNGIGKTPRGPLRQQLGADPYILPIMYGMMRITTTRIKGNTLTLTLMTRRSRHRAGTRYFSRGIDEEGHVSNYNETEQIAVLNDSAEGLIGYGNQSNMGKSNLFPAGGDEKTILSYVQTRGSVPVYWAEVNKLKYTPTLEVRGVETAAGAAQKHFREQIELYGENYLVNLVNQKGREKRVKDAYEQMVNLLQTSSNEGASADQRSSEKLRVIEPAARKSIFDRLHYIYFDFHNETKGLKWERALLLLDKLKPGLMDGGYFRAVDMPGDKEGRLDVRSRQSAVVRTNCMDCLDRTNVVQSMIARWTLTRQLQDIGILGPNESIEQDLAFEDLFRNTWADNADVVSKSYSGTGALKTDFTRTGKRTKLGALQDLNNSITRYVRNNFLDGPKQDGFDVFLGKYKPPSTGGNYVFADRRPLPVQSMPYLLAASIFLVVVALISGQSPGGNVWVIRIFEAFWAAVAAYSFNFITKNGMLYVNWPKLNTSRAAEDGLQNTMDKVQRDPLMGAFVARDRGASTARISAIEEGKKRIQ